MNLTIEILLWVTYLMSLFLTLFWLLLLFEKRKFFFRTSYNKIKLKRHPSVSVIIPAYNEEGTIEATIDSVLSLDYPKEKLEVVIVDDCSKDRTSKVVGRIIARNPGRDIKLILHRKNMGKARGLNNALKSIHGEYFACLDADSIVHREALKRMLHTFENGAKGLSIVTPAMRVKKPMTTIQVLQRLEYIVSMMMMRIMGLINVIYVAPGPFSVYRTSIVRKLGGFDEDNLTEDQEIAYRMQMKHYKLIQSPQAYVFTSSPFNIGSLYKQRNRWFKGSLLNIFKYKKILFNKEYSDFGFFQFPVNLLTYLMAFLTVFFSFYYFIKPFLESFWRFMLVGFDFKPYINSLDIKIDLYNIALDKVFLTTTLLLIAILFIYIALKNANEKVAKRDYIYIIPYLFVYFIFMSFVSIVVVFEVMIGKRQKW